MARDYWGAVEAYLRHCFFTSNSPRVDELASLMQLHPSSLSRMFKALTGRRLSAVLKERQIAEAQHLLAATTLRLDEVARRAGFGTPNSLFRVFRTHVGLTPEQYRQKTRGGEHS